MLQKYTLIKPILETSSKNGTNLKHQGQKKNAVSWPNILV